jgi:DNA-binding CsgD family transcriptional regulator
VVELVAEGLTNPEVAERMFISRRPKVDTHLGHIFPKLVHSRAGLSAQAAGRRRQPS